MAARRESHLANDEVPGQIKQILCQPCLNRDKQSTAEKFCSTCNEFQCKKCLKGHYKYAFMKGHKLVNAQEANSNQVSFDMKGLDQCNQHGEILKFFCEDENQLCCSTCAIVDHRKCNSVIAVQKVVGKISSKSSNSKLILQDIKQKAEIIVNNVVDSKGKLDEGVKKLPVTIRRMRDEVLKMFDDLEASVVRDAKSLQKEEMKKLTKKQSQNEKYLADIQSYLETIDSVYQNGTFVEKFIIEQKLQKEVNDLQSKVDAECQNLETVAITFDFDDTLSLPPLPIVDYVPGKLSLMSHLSEAASKICPDFTAMKISTERSIDVKSEDEEKEPHYSGIDFLPDGRLVAVDNFNKKCLVYNQKLEKVGSYQLSVYPLSVVAVSKEEVAITSTTACKVDILRVDDSNNITLERTYEVSTQYDSICLKDGGHFIVGTIDHPTPVRILSVTGEEKDFNFNFPNKTYPKNMSSCTYIRNHEKVVLTDRHEHAVYIYDIKTNTRVVVKDDQIKEPRGVAVGPSDTILVCSMKTNSIVQISQTGRIIKSHKMDMKFPCKISVSHDKSFLVVTNAYPGQKKIQKLKLSFC